MQPSPTFCKNCGSPLTGRYCSQCGEKVYDDHDKSILHLAEETVHFATHFEGSFFTTFKTFLTRPGRFSADYCNGIRKKYFRPISFFLMMVIFYLLFPYFRGLNMHYSSYISKENRYSWYALPVARKKIKTHGITDYELAEKYDKKSPVFAKLFLLALIPLSAAVLALLFYTSKRYFFDHFIVATEILSFYIFFEFLFVALLYWLVQKTIPSLSYLFDYTSWLQLILKGIILVFTGVAFRNFYRQKWWLSMLKALVFFVVFVLVLQDIYNILLYHIVMLFI